MTLEERIKQLEGQLAQYQETALISANREIARLRARIKALEALQAVNIDALRVIAIQSTYTD